MRKGEAKDTPGKTKHGLVNKQVTGEAVETGIALPVLGTASMETTCRNPKLSEGRLSRRSEGRLPGRSEGRLPQRT
ncbi:hypothetical protein ACOMHN_036135 [Nucella lapillus]